MYTCIQIPNPSPKAFFMKIHSLLVLVVIIVTSQPLTAQQNRVKIKFGDVKPGDFDSVRYAVDTAANAVYLFDGAKSFYEGNTKGGLSVVYERHTRIHLLNKNSFDLATIEIPLYVTTYFQQKVEDLQAAPYNIENGKVVATKIDKSALFKDKNGNEKITKFTFPNIKEGSIIEYSYKVITPDRDYVQTWFFQKQYPSLWSEYEVSIPSFYHFAVNSQHYWPYTIDTGMISHDSYNILAPGESAMESSTTFSIPSNTVNSIWAMKNVPAIKREPFISAIKNYVAKIEFHMASIQYPERPLIPVIKTWPEMAADYLKDEDFGADLSSRNSYLEDELKKVTADAKDDLLKAKKIYEYVRDNFSCNDYEARYLSQSLKKTFQARKGNVVDINLLLTAMLINQKLEAQPVILSTRENGKALESYPIMDRFNYAISRVKIGDQYYLLDAANDRLGFGRLDEECYNGTGRLIAPLPELIQLSPDSLKESKVTSVFIINGEKGIEGSVVSNLGYFESLNNREKLKKTKEEDFFKELKKGYSFDVELENTRIDSLKKLENPIAIKYDLKFNLDEDIVYFNPMLAEVTKENPFKSAERYYPVEMPYCSDETYVLNMEIPNGYKVDELPKSARVKLNEDDGMFEYIIVKSDDRIQFKSRISLKKAIFDPEDYQTLRDIFGFIVKKQAETIVFKKAK